ncbi:MAG: hypothetical protein NC229_08460 [Bacteroides sp.]|nr:hypothetical protein [Bacteroidales bacterium]MCM1068724.1 hypothetical protein [Prevotella sp.]MCM1354676.1 hypothetical protein [Bacteroides sp.]MCM1403776.1 hypothetical protein [Bacteroides sp.]MCM1443506.1 hypothetical protein [Muribaculum sp.]
MERTIRIPHGNDFVLSFPFLFDDGNGKTEINTNELTDVIVEVVVGNEHAFYDYVCQNHYINVLFKGDIHCGIYSVHISAIYQGVKISTHLHNCFYIVRWNSESNNGNFIHNSPYIVRDSVVYGFPAYAQEVDIEEITTEEIDNLFR